MKILMPVDGSENNQKMLLWACDFLANAKVRIFLLNVTLIGMTEYPLYEQEHEEGGIIVEKARKWLEMQGFNVVQSDALTTHTSVENAICEYADQWGVDQILMGSHGRKGLMDILMGSVSEAVFKNAKQPVLILNSGTHQPSLKISHIEKVSIFEAD